MSRLSYVIAGLFAASLALSAPAFADSEIGIINVEKIMAKSKAAQSVRTQLQSKQKSFQAELDAKQKQLVQEDQELVKQKNTLAKDAFEKKVKDFQAKAATAQREIQTKKSSLDKAFAAALGQIQEKVVAISKNVAENKDLKAIISASQVLYGDPELDITDDVLEQLDSDLPSVSVKF